MTLFSWGYWGWGNATEQLVKAVDVAERERGFGPPIFVDTRLRRQGRAKGFVGDSFRDCVGESRYRWMNALGNLEILTGGRGVRIKNPAAIAELFEIALRAADEKRHVLFYCACEFPEVDGNLTCHRREITDLLLAHARQIGRAVSVEEWPGGEPTEVHLEIDRKLFSSVTHGRRSIPFDRNRLSDFAGLPWGSVVVLDCDGGATTRDVLVGPARFAVTNNGGFWYMPVIELAELGASKELLLARAADWRKAHGIDRRVALADG